MKRKKLIISIILIAMIIVTIGISYAYFSGNFEGGEEATTISVGGGKLEIVYNGGENINISNIFPQDNAVATKTFTVTGINTTDLEMKYDLILVIESNTFSSEAIKYKLISENTNNNGEVSPSITNMRKILNGSNIYDLGTGTFTGPTDNKVHTYKLEIYFPNEEYDQNAEQGKTLTGHIEIKNYTAEPILAGKMETGGISTIMPTTMAGITLGEVECKKADGETIEGVTALLIGTSWIIDLGEEEIEERCSCTISFKDLRLKDLILAQGGGTIAISAKGNPNFAALATATDTGLYATQDEYGTSYYYRGVKDNLKNNLIFAGFQWKIVRINGDGSIRVMYNGTCPNDICTINSTGAATQIAGTPVWNSPHNDAKYSGYMFGGANGSPSESRAVATTNETNSNAKTQLDNWYLSNIVNQGSNITNKIVDNMFCSDRQRQNEVGGGSTGTGYGTSATAFASNYRLTKTSKIPTLKCGLKNDRFTVSDTTLGNGALTYPVGLIIADEVSMAGLVYDKIVTTNYLYTGQSYWGFSPYSFSGSSARIWMVLATGKFSENYSTLSSGLRPVISLSPDVKVTGDGSAATPFKVV